MYTNKIVPNKINYGGINMVNLEELKDVRDLTIEEQYDPRTIAKVQVGPVHVGNYKFRWEHRFKLANLLAVGGKAVVYLAYSKHAPIEVQFLDEDINTLFRLRQLEYLIERYGHRIRPEYYRTFGKEYFGKPSIARDFFKGNAWKEMNKGFQYATDVLDDEFRLALEALEDARAINLQEYHTKISMNNLWRLAADARVFKRHIEEPLHPVNVIPAQEQVDDYVKTNRRDSYTNQPTKEVYWKSRSRYEETEVTKLEAKIVSAWLNRDPQFIEPTREEMADELLELREWFQDMKDQVRPIGRTKVKPTKETIAKFDRLEQLEVEVGGYVDGLNPYNMSSNADNPAIMDWDK